MKLVLENGDVTLKPVRSHKPVISELPSVAWEGDWIFNINYCQWLTCVRIIGLEVQLEVHFELELESILEYALLPFHSEMVGKIGNKPSFILRTFSLLHWFLDSVLSGENEIGL